MTKITIFKNYYFRIIIKNLTKCNILSTFTFKNFEKFADRNLEILCLWSLAATIPVRGLERCVLDATYFS